MGSENGNGRIVSLGDRRLPKDKASDWATKGDVQRIVQEECAKVHEHYLNQIPKFTAQMIQDALAAYGILKVVEPDTNAPTLPETAAPDAAPPDSEAPEGMAVTDGDETPHMETTAP